MSDFSLMDAIECGIVKLPRVPVADNIPGAKVPIFRNLWEHIRSRMPKKGRGKAEQLDPLKIPLELQTALEALYGHYRQTFHLWAEKRITVPPCFIVVCNNTSTSKLVFDYISGFYPPSETGTAALENGRLELFRNFDEHGNKYARPRTLIIDSTQLESGEALDDTFRQAATGEIERFRQEIVDRTGLESAAQITDQEILREAMNTVGKPGKLGGEIRCIVSVSMLTEGWDANTVTHILGVRAFGTQLLCEQVIGRALRRQSYELNDKNLFDVEYADVLGIPFDFTAQPVISAPQPPPQTIQVRAMRPDRDQLEIRFPRVSGYRVELPNEQLEAAFTADSVLTLTPDLVRAPSVTQNAGIIGEGVNLTLAHLRDMRRSTLLLHLTKHLVFTKWRDQGEEARLELFGQLKRIAKEWLDNYLECKGDTYPAQLMHRELADMACEKITAAITKKMMDYRPVKVLLDPYNPTGSSRHVRFNTSKSDLYQTAPDKCHINWVVLDSTWEAELCRVIESHPQVKAYVKNHNLGFEVPYLYGGEPRRYLPDFIVLLEGDLHLVIEVKGFRREDAKDKKNTMDAYWIPGVNNSGRYGRWAFAEFTDVYAIESEFNKLVTGATA
jgi:type III restriction enzyme